MPTTVQERIARPTPTQRAPGDGGALTGADILAMLRRRLVLIVVLFVLLSAMVAGGYAAWWKYYPGYRSEALIECISNVPDVELTLEQSRLRQDEHERFVMTQALLLKSPGILSEALKVTAVHETQWFSSVKNDQHLLELTDELGAAPIRGTNFLRVRMQCRDPEDPAIIVNEVVREWFESVKKRSADEFANVGLAAARQELEALDADITNLRQRLKTLATRLPAGARQNPGGNITNQQVQQYGEQVALLQLERAQLEQYRLIYNDPSGVAVTAEDRAVVEANPQVAELARTLFLLEQQRAADEKVYGDAHSALRQLDAQIEAALGKLAQIRMEKLDQRRADIREAANTAYDNTQHSLFLAEENLLRSAASLQDQDALLFDYVDLEAELERKLERSVELADYIAGLRRVKTQRTAINVNVAQQATDPLRRSSPSLLLLPVGIVLALLASTGIALGLELVDKSMRTSHDVVHHLGVALLGLVPHTDDEELSIQRVETAAHDAPQSMVAEAFRHIRANLQFSAPIDRQRCILITSARPEDGKTTVACNVAIALAQAGRRVLLIDANFRRPSLQALFEGVKPQGLSNLLVGDDALASCTVSTPTTGLDVLGSGPTPPNPAELLGSERFRAVLKEAMSQYDQVIIDTPPVLLASDAVVLATAVDGVVLVVRAHQNSRGVARRACNLLSHADVRLFGAVLNAAQVTRGGYFREQLRAYYDYQVDTAGGGKNKPLPSTPPSSDA